MAKIHISEVDSLSDRRIDLKVTGLKPQKIYTFHGSAITDMNDEFESLATYKADETGCIDFEHGHSLGGTYSGNEPMGLFWSMKPSSKYKDYYPRLIKLKISTPLSVKISLLGVEVVDLSELLKLKQNESTYQRLELTSVIVSRWFKAKTTKRIPLTEKKDGICGTLFVPGGSGPFPAVLVMFGGQPGTFEFKASLLASYGFVTLALAYLDFEGLPPLYPIFIKDRRLELEYFIKAVNFLCNHPVVDSQNGVGVVSISYATLIALRLAEFCPKVTCVIWINGFLHLTFCDLHYNGTIYQPADANMEKALTTNFREAIYNPLKTSGDISITEDGQAINFHKQKDVAYMFISSLNDTSLKAELHINHAEKLLKIARHPNYHILRYPGAGHLIEPPYGNCNSITSVRGGLFNVFWGGKVVPHCKSQEDSWKKQIEFLKTNLVLKNAKL